MRNENEIKALPLEEKQKLAIELSGIKPGDKAYANAKALLEVITTSKGYKAPVQVEVKNTADHEVTVDGAAIAPEATGKVYPWQLTALARFLEPVGKAAALLLFCLLLGLGVTASAQSQAFLYGTFGQYNVQSVAGLNGGTNAFQGTNATFAVPSYITNTLVQPNWVVSNGVTTVTFSTNIASVVTNVPGVVSVVNYDSFGIQQSFNLLGAGSGSFITSWDVSGDNTSWQTNAFSVATTASGTSIVTTCTNLTQQQYGFIRLNTASIAATGNAGAVTNLTVEIIKKSNRQGP